jgi:hypothetical protein
MSLQNFTPEKWAASLFVQLRKNLVLANLVNRDYEGDIRQAGDTVRINEIGAVTIGDYTKDSTISWQNPDSAQKVLRVDQAKYFAIQYDDIDRAQNQPKLMDGLMQEAAYQIMDTVDQHLAGLYTQAGATVTGIAATTGGIIQNVSDLGLALDENNVPTQGRFLIVPPWYAHRLMIAITGGSGATSVPKLTNDGVAINGFVGNFYGFNIVQSNNVNNDGTTWNIMALTQQAITHASQVAAVEAVRIQDSFADGLKGLYLYGSKVVRPNALVKCAVTKA